MLYCMAGALLEGPASAGLARSETAAMAANVIFFNMGVDPSRVCGFEMGTWFPKCIFIATAV